MSTVIDNPLYIVVDKAMCEGVLKLRSVALMAYNVDLRSDDEDWYEDWTELTELQRQRLIREHPAFNCRDDDSIAAFRELLCRC